MRASQRKFAAGGLLGLTVSLTACGPKTTASPPAKTHSASVSSTSAPAGPPSPVPTTSAAAPPTPGVVAACTSAPPLPLSVKPAVIALACADNGWGVERMRWNAWAGATATGQGTFWEKLCHPNCAEGHIGTYPVVVTLSDVKTSPRGPWFSRLTVSWQGTRPPGTTPPFFALSPPTG